MVRCRGTWLSVGLWGRGTGEEIVWCVVQCILGETGGTSGGGRCTQSRSVIIDTLGLWEPGFQKRFDYSVIPVIRWDQIRNKRGGMQTLRVHGLGLSIPRPFFIFHTDYRLRYRNTPPHHEVLRLYRSVQTLLIPFYMKYLILRLPRRSGRRVLILDTRHTPRP